MTKMTKIPVRTIKIRTVIVAELRVVAEALTVIQIIIIKILVKEEIQTEIILTVGPVVLIGMIEMTEIDQIVVTGVAKGQIVQFDRIDRNLMIIEVAIITETTKIIPVPVVKIILHRETAEAFLVIEIHIRLVVVVIQMNVEIIDKIKIIQEIGQIVVTEDGHFRTWKKA